MSMNPLVLVDQVVEDYWKDEIGSYLSDSPYDSFCEDVFPGPHRLLSVKEALEKLPLPSEEEERPVWEFFNFDELANDDLKPYTYQDLCEDIEYPSPIFNAVQSLAGKPKNTEWREIICDLSFFDAGTVRKTNDELEEEFDVAFDDAAYEIGRELEFLSKPLVEYTDNPAKKIWEKTTVDGVPLFEFLGI